MLSRGQHDGRGYRPDVQFLANRAHLANFLRTLPAFTRAYNVNSWYAYVGDPDIPEQEADMRARSPITMVDKIRTPLLVAQGANDVRVVKAESDNIVASLRERGVPVTYLVADDEGHERGRESVAGPPSGHARWTELRSLRLGQEPGLVVVRAGHLQADGNSRLLLRRHAQTTTRAARMVSGQPIAIRATPSQPVSSLT
jgi:Prolyl oligopeptidase family